MSHSWGAWQERAPEMTRFWHAPVHLSPKLPSVRNKLLKIRWLRRNIYFFLESNGLGAINIQKSRFCLKIQKGEGATETLNFERLQYPPKK